MADDLDALRNDICEGKLDSWKAIHERYNELWSRYPEDKLNHAVHCLCDVMGVKVMTPDTWLQALAYGERIQRRIAEQVYTSRKKDHDNVFRACTCRNDEELKAVFGDVDENSFVRQMRNECNANLAKIDRLRNWF